MKYYYTLGYYAKQIGRHSPFNHWGWDVRSWVMTTQVKEVSKESYEKIVALDQEIVKEYKEKYGLTIKTHHGPFTVEE